MKKPTEHDTFLRDFFAAMAMPVCLQVQSDQCIKSKLPFSKDEWQAVAASSYTMADAMMEERQKK